MHFRIPHLLQDQKYNRYHRPLNWIAGNGNTFYKLELMLKTHTIGCHFHWYVCLLIEHWVILWSCYWAQSRLVLKHLSWNEKYWNNKITHFKLTSEQLKIFKDWCPPLGSSIELEQLLDVSSSTKSAKTGMLFFFLIYVLIFFLILQTMVVGKMNMTMWKK